jgi:hypothetical protein
VKAGIRIAFIVVVLTGALGVNASAASASRHWSGTRCRATYRAWRKHHRHASARRRVSVAGGYDKHHGCRLPLPAEAVHPVVLPPAPAPAPAPPPVPVPTPTHVVTPVTVYNVCHINPGLGTAFYGSQAQGFTYPVVYWLYKANQQLAFFAAATEGELHGEVDTAFFFSPGSTTLTALARCTWPEWVNLAVWNQEHSSAPPITSASLAIDNPIFSEVTPDGPGCAGAEDIETGAACYVEPDPDADSDEY